MSMREWAKNEVELECKREKDNALDEEWNYGVACYKSALKAFNCLIEDGHSGMSIGLTKNILNRLIDGKPLGPIEDTEDAWGETHYSFGDLYKTYQCKRMDSLFKYVYQDGTVKYKDNDLFYCIDINNPNRTYNSGLVFKIMNEIFPITMPYYPSTNKIKVYCEDFLTDPINGDFDTVGIFYAIKANGDKVDINRFFKYDDTDDDWVEINPTDYEKRKEMTNCEKA